MSQGAGRLSTTPLCEISSKVKLPSPPPSGDPFRSVLLSPGQAQAGKGAGPRSGAGTVWAVTQVVSARERVPARGRGRLGRLRGWSLQGSGSPLGGGGGLGGCAGGLCKGAGPRSGAGAVWAVRISC